MCSYLSLWMMPTGSLSPLCREIQVWRKPWWLLHWSAERRPPLCWWWRSCPRHGCRGGSRCSGGFSWRPSAMLSSRWCRVGSLCSRPWEFLDSESAEDRLRQMYASRKLAKEKRNSGVVDLAINSLTPSISPKHAASLSFSSISGFVIVLCSSNWLVYDWIELSTTRAAVFKAIW